MGRPGLGALDTPRTNVGDATYLYRPPPDLDVSQLSIRSPAKGGAANLFGQARNGRDLASLRTPRARPGRAERRDPPARGTEFTPLLKSATRNHALRLGRGGAAAAIPPTPLGLDRIDPDLTALPPMEASVYGASRHDSYLDNTLPQVDASSDMSTPLAIPQRRNASAPLQDGNQLSLREQENVIDRIERENFGLKLKIHFLEEALSKAGPGMSEAALRENTELKVDQVTMKRELGRYKKHLVAAEKDLEDYRQQMVDFQERAKRKYVDETARAELETLRQNLGNKDADIEHLQRQLDQGHSDQEQQLERLQGEVADLEADARERDRIISEREDELNDLKEKLEEADAKARESRRKILDLEEKAQADEELEKANNAIDDLERHNQRLESKVVDLETRLEGAASDRERAEANLEELQEEMANKSVAPKGLSRQMEEKVAKLQVELEQAGHEFEALERQHAQVLQENDQLRSQTREGKREHETAERQRRTTAAELEEVRADLEARTGERTALKARNETLAAQAVSLQQEIDRLENAAQRLEEDLTQEREHGLEIENHIRGQAKEEIDRLNSEISNLQAEIREKDDLYDNDSEKWETDRLALESERDRAVERAAGLQHTIDRLREFEGAVTTKEAKLQETISSETQRHQIEEALLGRRIDELQQALETRQASLVELRSEISAVRDELRQKDLDYHAQLEKVEALEDEVEVMQLSFDDATEQARQDLDAAEKTSDDLRRQLEVLRRTTIATSSRQLSTRASEVMSQLETQLSELTSQLLRVNGEKQGLQDELDAANVEIHTLKSSLAEAQASQEGLHDQIQRLKPAGDHNHTALRLDREQMDLRTSKIKLENEVRRLKEENRDLLEEKASLQQLLEDEVARAADEEERLRGDLHQLQSAARQSSASDGQDLASARRTIRDLERRVDEYKSQLAASSAVDLAHPPTDGNSELSLVRRDLTTARQRELEYLQRESSHKDTVRGFKRQVADLERQIHEAEVSRFVALSPTSSGSADSARKAEVSELRHQLSVSQQSVLELRAKVREAERKVTQSTQALHDQLRDLEEQKLELELSLEDARRDGEEAATVHSTALRRLRQKLEKLKREQELARSASTSKGEARELAELLRRTQDEADGLEHDVREQQSVIDALVAAESGLRRKLERARSERAAYRLTAEKLQRDAKGLRAGVPAAVETIGEKKFSGGGAAGVAVAPVDPAGAGPEALREQRHLKELRGMMMQMEWMQARWEREAMMRADVAYAKKFMQLQLEVATACNNAQLRELEHIRKDILGNRGPLPALTTALQKQQQRQGRLGAMAKLRAGLAAVLFVIRTGRGAKTWAGHEEKRKKIARCVEDMKRQRKWQVFRPRQQICQ